MADPDPTVASDHWIHDLDPVALPLWGDLAIRWYGLAYVLGIFLGWWLMRRFARKGLIPMSDQQVSDTALWIGLGMVIGGRLGYCIFYQPSLFLDWGGGFPWWGVLKIHQGGMASHGGIIGFFVAGCWYAHRQKLPIWVFGDGVATVIPIGIVLGRLANFINGELWGRPTDVPWAVKFPKSVAAGDLPAIGSEAWYQLGMLAQPRHPSQLYAVLLEGLIPLTVALLVYGRHRRPGLNIGIVLSLYAIGRVVGEFFREPDAQFREAGETHGFVLAQFSMGQLLTVPVFLVGCWFLWRAWRRGPQPERYAAAPSAADDPRPTPRD